MFIAYRDHAEAEIHRRNISKTSVGEALKHPDSIETGKFGRLIAQKFLGEKVLRVVFEKVGNNYTVITAYLAKASRYKK